LRSIISGPADRLFGRGGGVDPALSIGDVSVPEHWGQYLEVMLARKTGKGWKVPEPSPEGAPENWEFLFPNGTIVGNADEPARNHMTFAVDPGLLALARKVAAGISLEACVAPSAGQSAQTKLCLPHQPKVEVGAPAFRRGPMPTMRSSANTCSAPGMPGCSTWKAPR
jgi:adenosylhomocysteine nucleosidase